VTGEVFRDQFHTPLKALDLPVPLQKHYNPNNQLIDLIEKPQWVATNYSVKAKNTLIPDIITITKQNNKSYFIILDAKYYVMQMHPHHISRQPGMELSIK